MFQHIRDNTSFSRTPSIAMRIHSGNCPIKRRAYLDIPCQNHRICLTRILCASHDLAVEALRRKEYGNARIDRAERLCRLCGTISGAVEEIHHALFCCKGHLGLLTLRIEFFRNMPMVKQDLLPVPTDEDEWNRLIGTWADDVTSAIPLARLAWHVTRLFYEFPIHTPVIPSVSVLPAPPPLPNLDPPPQLILDPNSDYSSEDEPIIPTESGER
jgi:hypothetical protein